MDYTNQQSTIQTIKFAASLYQKQEYSSVIYLLHPLSLSHNIKIAQYLGGAYYSTKMFRQALQICQNFLSNNHQTDTMNFTSIKFLKVHSEYQLGTDSWKANKQELENKTKTKIQLVDKRVNTQKPEQILKSFNMLLQKEQKNKYFSFPDLPVYIIPIEWIKNLESGQVGPINSNHLIKPNTFIDDKVSLHMNYLLKQEMRQQQDYKIVGANTWKYLTQTVGGTQVKRFTIKIGSAVLVEAKFRLIRILCVTPHKTKLVTLSVSRLESIQTIKQRIKRILMRYNLVDKQAIMNCKSPRLIHIKNIHNPQTLSKQIHATSGQIIDYPCIELNEISIIQQTQILPKQFLIFQLTKSSIFHSTKQQHSGPARCLTCSNADPPILCQCKTVKYCSAKCKANNTKHQTICKGLQKQRSGIDNLISAFNIDRDVRVPTDLKASKTGLQNIGNTCFLNAAMQCIIGIDKLSLYFFKNQHLKDINFRNPLGSEGKLACAYGQFLKQIFFTNKRAIQPRILKKIIEKKNSTFSGYQQQDSQQFLSYFLDLLHQDLNKIKDKPNVQNIQSDGRPDQTIARISLQNYQKRNRSIVADLMVGQYRSELVCPDCGKISITFDPYMTVTLPLPNNRDRLQLTGYFIGLDGIIQKVQQMVPNKTVEHIFQDCLKYKLCHAAIKQKEIVKIFDKEESISTLANSRYSIFMYQIGDHRDVEIQLLLYWENTRQLCTITRRIFTKQIHNQKQLEQLIYSRLKDPLTKGFSIKEDEDYLKYCFDNKLFNFDETNGLNYPLKKGVHKAKVYLKDGFKSKLKLNSSYGQVSLLKQASEMTIPNLLKNFSIPQKLTQDNSWYCNVCKKHQLATKKLSLYSVPEYLILHLKRFTNKIHGRWVFNQKIDTPIKLNDVQEINGKKYELFGIVNHMGTMSGGHYTSFVKKHQWLYFDDQRCKKMEVSGVYAYLLFYKAIS